MVKSPNDGETSNSPFCFEGLDTIPPVSEAVDVAQAGDGETSHRQGTPAVNPKPCLTRGKRLDPIFEDAEAELDAHREATLCERPKRAVKKPIRFIESVKAEPARLDVLFCGAIRKRSWITSGMKIELG